MLSDARSQMVHQCHIFPRILLLSICYWEGITVLVLGTTDFSTDFFWVQVHFWWIAVWCMTMINSHTLSGLKYDAGFVIDPSFQLTTNSRLGQFRSDQDFFLFCFHLEYLRGLWTNAVKSLLEWSWNVLWMADYSDFGSTCLLHDVLVAEFIFHYRMLLQLNSSESWGCLFHVFLDNWELTVLRSAN